PSNIVNYISSVIFLFTTIVIISCKKSEQPKSIPGILSEQVKKMAGIRVWSGTERYKIVYATYSTDTVYEIHEFNNLEVSHDSTIFFGDPLPLQFVDIDENLKKIEFRFDDVTNYPNNPNGYLVKLIY